MYQLCMHSNGMNDQCILEQNNALPQGITAQCSVLLGLVSSGVTKPRRVRVPLVSDALPLPLRSLGRYLECTVAVRVLAQPRPRWLRFVPRYRKALPVAANESSTRNALSGLVLEKTKE